jgi:adenylylsulfate kinase-like enzyme|tara:strand:- start:336 stop:464 length:129 start_codon:yes stop_codon:yes gene_type:complete
MKTAKIFWFTGLSGAGKTSMAEGSKQIMEQKGLSDNIEFSPN